MTELTLVYMLAGLSSRFGGNAKALANIGPNKETLLEYSLNQAIHSGITKIIFIVSKKTEPLFREKFGNSYNKIPIEYSLQTFDENKREKPWGTNDALCSAKSLIDSNFIVCNGDDIYGKEAFEILANHLKKENSNATLGYKLGKVLSDKGSVNRGIFKTKKENKVEAVTENIGITEQNLDEKGLTKESLTSMNIFALTKDTLNLLSEKLEKFKEKNKEDPKVECFLPTELNNLIKENKIEINLYPTEDRWFGLTYPEDVEIVREELKKTLK